MTTLRFQSKTELTPDVWQFVFQPDQPIGFVPGQYAHFRLPRERARAFTITSLPSESIVQFVTRVEMPASTYKQCLMKLAKGDIVEIDEPMGDCILPRDPAIPIVLVAQGIAIASYLTILKSLTPTPFASGSVLDAKGAERRGLTFIWVRRSEDDRLETLIPGEIPGLVRIDLHYPERLQASTILAHLKENTLIYLSGSQAFVEALGAGLETKGLQRARIIYDYYDGYNDL